MAIKYCDHGAYSPSYARFTVAGAVANSTLTVSSMIDGTIVSGQRVSWAGQPAGTDYYILASGTSTGGTGTFNMSAAATIAAGTQVETFGTGTLRNGYNPTVWGTPIDGDGQGVAPATSAAIASIDFTNTTVPSSGAVLSVMGCTAIPITTAANSATNIQWSATLSTLLANIVTVINTLATATVADVPTNWNTHQVRNVVLARVVGSTIELMTVSGSELYNGRVAISVAGVSPSNITAYWSGGTSGCWGLVLSQQNVGPSGNLDYRTAGVGVFQQGGVIAGSIDPGDTVYLRSDKDIYIGGSGTGQNIISPKTVATTDNPPVFVVDTGDIWSYGVSNPKLRIYNEVSGVVVFRASSGSSYVIKGTRYNDDEYSLVIARKSGASYADFVVDTQFSASVYGTEIVDSSASGNILKFLPVNTGTSHASCRVFHECKIKFNGYYSLFRQSGNSSSGYSLIVSDSIVEHYNVALPIGSIINTGTSTTSPVQNILLDSVRFKGFQAGSNLVGVSSDERSPQFVVTAKNCDWGNVVLRGPILAQSLSFYGPNLKLISGYSQYGGRDLFIDSGLGCVEWNSARGFPTLSARIYGSNDPWSIKLTPTTFGRLSLQMPLETPRFGKFNTLPSGSRTIKVELLVHADLPVTTSDLTLVANYLDTSGVLRTTTSYLNSTTVLGDSAATWTNLREDGTVFFVDQSTEQTYIRKYISVILPGILGTMDPANAANEVSIAIRLHKSSTAIVQGIFVDPNFILT